MSKRIEKIRIAIKKLKLDALFVTDQHNVTYLTNFAGLSPNEREGFLLITKLHAYLLTFPTYFGLYKKGTADFQTLNITQTKKLSDHLSEIICREKINNLGFEKENLTVSELDSLKNKLLKRSDLKGLIPTQGIVENLRQIKDEIEIANIKKAAEITDQAFAFIRNKITKGISEKNLAVEIEYFIKRHAQDVAFSPIVAYDANAAIPHYLPSHNSQLTTHNLILLDFGAKVNGYCADMTRVIFFGKPKDKQIKAYQTVLSAQKIVLLKLKAGLKCQEVDKLAKKIITAKGYPEYQHGLGHGVGLAIHEAPKLKFKSKEILQENMVVTVEPGIYLPDDYGIRIEDLVVLRKDGIEILSKSSKEITVIRK